MATSSSERDQQLLSIGRQCSHQSCNLVDFLPFKCQHCAESFCQDHFKVDAHKCPKYDESKYNRVAPTCPLCNEIVSIPAGQDPNIRMEKHISSECSVMTGRRAKAKSTPVCARGKCGKVLFAPIRCDKCRQQFCPQHRFPTDHNCTAPVVSAPTSAAKSFASASQTAAQMSSKASAASASAMDAFKKTIASAGSSSSGGPIGSRQTSAPASTSKPTIPNNPFSKSDRSSPLVSIAPVSPTRKSSVSSIPPVSPPTPTSTTPDNDTALKSKPDPVIDYMSFIPRSIFASA